MADTAAEFLDDIPEGICNDFAKGSRLEWLQTNHTGAFAMGTVCGVNTRRYHGLLIASLNPPSDRYSILPRVEETVECSGKTFALASVQYPGTVSPSGHELLEGFSASPFPTWRYRLDSSRVSKSIRLVDGEQSVVVSYSATTQCRLSIRLFISCRDYHSLMHRNSALNTEIIETPGRLTLQPYQDLPPLSFYYSPASFDPDAKWYSNHEYLRELERGLDFREDLYSPGVLHFDLPSGESVFLIATLEKTAPSAIAPAKPFSNRISQALDQFRVYRSDTRPTLIAGYPWFTDWSRDTLISLPALMATGFEPADTRAILEFLLAERKQGILPNRFSDRQSTPEFNTVDASLWFFVAADAYIQQTADRRFLEQTLIPAAIDIIDWHKRGTFYGIQVDPSDHLLAAGEPGAQLTWMDAKIGDHPVTPRTGKPVEINALWFNALQISSSWAATIGNAELAKTFAGEACAVKNAFAKFWNDSRGCLYDVLSASGPDASLRPNQLFALSLPYPLVDQTQARMIIKIVRDLLLTPVGLRTLEPADPRYCSHYAGDMAARDSAYHQGTVWPWLIGPFIQAYLYAFDNSQAAKTECRRILQLVRNSTTDYCLGSIGEVYDGEAPHHPGGCPAQLWSVAQIALSLSRVNES